MDWIIENLGKLLLIFFVAFGFLIAFAIKEDKENFNVFMQQCMEDKKEYECFAMWRGTQSNVVPMPVIVPVR